MNIKRKSLFGALLLALAMLTVSAIAGHAATLPTLKLCTGAPDGNYDFSGVQIKQQSAGVLDLQLVNTAGSMDNLAKLDSGECDAAIVQNDAFGVYKKRFSHSLLTLERGMSLYPEYLHLICNKDAGLDKITGLTAKMILFVGQNGGGTATTWESFVNADPKRYGVVQTLPLGGLRAASRVQQGEDGTCMAFVTGLLAASVQEVNALSKQSGGKLVLVPTNDRDLLKVKDAHGKLLYVPATIPSDTYPGGLQPSSWTGNAVDTVAVESIIVTNVNYIDGHDRAYTSFLRAVTKALPAIKQRVGIK